MIVKFRLYTADKNIVCAPKIQNNYVAVQFFSMLLFFIALSKVIALVGRTITIWEAVQKWSYEQIYKTNTINEAKRLWAITRWGTIKKKPNIAIAILENEKIDSTPRLFHFFGHQ